MLPPSPKTLFLVDCAGILVIAVILLWGVPGNQSRNGMPLATLLVWGAGRLYADYICILAFVSVIRTLHIYLDATANGLLYGCVFNFSGLSFRTAHARRRNLFPF